MRKEEDRRDGPAGHVAFSKTHAHPSQSTRSRRPLTPLAFDQAHVSQVCNRARNDYVDCESQKARGSLVHGMLARTALTEITVLSSHAPFHLRMFPCNEHTHRDWHHFVVNGKERELR